MDKYEDIRNLPHHISKKHPQMPNCKRAAQFSPFAALSGHAEAARETERLTEKMIELDEYEIEKIDRALRRINADIADVPEAEITYFVPDERKSGGKYVKEKKRIQKIDSVLSAVITEDRCVIKIKYLYDIVYKDESFE